MDVETSDETIANLFSYCREVLVIDLELQQEAGGKIDSLEYHLVEFQ